MAIVKSDRAKKLLHEPRFMKNAQEPGMKKYPGSNLVLWALVQQENNLVKNLSLFGELKDHQKVLLESMATLLIGRPISKLDDLTVRECEAFLRDRNSEVSIDEMTELDEEVLKSAFKWMRTLSQSYTAQEYSFSSEKGTFEQLKLIDKVREIKAFLRSPEILTLYHNLSLPELVDVEDLTVYIQAPYDSEREKKLFEQLHSLGVEVFKEENLNFIPEDL